MSKAFKAFIESEHRDSDGYWIDLRPGWIVRGDAHGIVEDSKKAAYAKLRQVVPCDCEECRNLVK